MFPFPVDPEFVKQQKEAHDHLMLARNEFVASLNRMLGELPIEHLVTLHKLFGGMLNSDYSLRQELHHFDGQIMAILTHVHKVCTSCGLDHTEDLLKCQGES